MHSLLDKIDHLALTSKSIRSSASSISPGQGPFTTAKLNTPLGDLIRDVDASELGLFTIVPPPGHPSIPSLNANTNPETKSNIKGNLARVEFPGATPLKRPPRRGVFEEARTPRWKGVRGEDRRGEGGKDVADYEPEVYAEAALKYLDRYKSIRPMPRARTQVLTLLEELADARERIETLNETLQQVVNAAPAVPPTLSAAQEEKRMTELQGRLAELQKRKAALTQPKRTARPRASPSPHSPSPLKATHPQDHESAFWTTPGPAPTMPSVPSARTLRFTENLNLLNEPGLELGDDSSASFGSPVHKGLLASVLAEREGNSEGEESMVQGEEEIEQGDEYEEGEQTVVLSKVSVSSTSPPSSQSALPPSCPLTLVSSEQPSATESTKKVKMRISSEMECIAMRIWSTMGEIIMPGHPFDVSGSAAMNKPPRAKETIAYLQTLSTQTPNSGPDSPSASSLSSFTLSSASTDVGPGQTTTQQILVAHLLLALLGAQPGCSMPLTRLKDVVAERSGGGVVGAGATRALYGCVAKKLIKIQRGGGEQLVKFDL